MLNFQIKSTVGLQIMFPIEEIKYSCKQCDKEFSSKGYFFGTQKGSTWRSQIPLQCGKGFSSKGSVIKHKRAVHEGIKYPCGQRGQKFSQKGELAKHKRAVHEGVKYPCGQCGQQFSQKGNLERHKKSVHKSQ